MSAVSFCYDCLFYTKKRRPRLAAGRAAIYSLLTHTDKKEAGRWARGWCFGAGGQAGAGAPRRFCWPRVLAAGVWQSARLRALAWAAADKAALALAERAAPGFAARLQALEEENFRLRSALAAGAADAAENEALRALLGSGARPAGSWQPVRVTARAADGRLTLAAALAPGTPVLGQPGAAGGHRGRERRAQRHGRPARAGSRGRSRGGRGLQRRAGAPRRAAVAGRPAPPQRPDPRHGGDGCGRGCGPERWPKPPPPMKPACAESAPLAGTAAAGVYGFVPAG